jgi:hypothetical protein
VITVGDLDADFVRIKDPEESTALLREAEMALSEAPDRSAHQERHRRLRQNKRRCLAGRPRMSVQELKALARKHWDKWLPEKVSLLKREGRLNEELQAAANLVQKAMDGLSGDMD